MNHNVDQVPISDFINKELILFSMADNIRSIPSVVDGFKPGQRKVLFACFKRKLKAEIKVTWRPVPFLPRTSRELIRFSSACRSDNSRDTFRSTRHTTTATLRSKERSLASRKISSEATTSTSSIRMVNSELVSKSVVSLCDPKSSTSSTDCFCRAASHRVVKMLRRLVTSSRMSPRSPAPFSTLPMMRSSTISTTMDRVSSRLGASHSLSDVLASDADGCATRYIPVLPMVLVNGSDGIGTGWSSFVPNYNPSDIVDNLKRKIKGEEMEPMHPWYRGFRVCFELYLAEVRRSDVR